MAAGGRAGARRDSEVKGVKPARAEHPSSDALAPGTGGAADPSDVAQVPQDASRILVQDVVGREAAERFQRKVEDGYTLPSDDECEGYTLLSNDESECSWQHDLDMVAFQTEHFSEGSQERADADDEWEEMAAATAVVRQKTVPYELDLLPHEPEPDPDEQHFGSLPEAQAVVPSAMLLFHCEHFQEAKEEEQEEEEEEEEAEAMALLPPPASMLSFHTEHFEEIAQEKREPAAELKDLLKAELKRRLLLLAVSQQDRRIGELAAQVASAERGISDQESDLREMERRIGCLKLGAARLDQSIGSHKRALQDIEEQAAESEAEAPPPKLQYGADPLASPWTCQTPQQVALAQLFACPVSAA